MFRRPENIVTLKYLLQKAEKGGFAVGAFSQRYSSVIRAVFHAGQQTKSPMIVQVAQIELNGTNIPCLNLPRLFGINLKRSGPRYR